MQSSHRNYFFKGHALGNDYIVMDPASLDFPLSPDAICAICDRTKGIGGDGIIGVGRSNNADFGISIFNADGSEAEISGNGLRIFSLYVLIAGMTAKREFSVETLAGISQVRLEVDQRGEALNVSASMGQASFRPADLPCALDVDELVEEQFVVSSQGFTFTGVSVGNPHCVIFNESEQDWTREDLLRLGPTVEHHALFPRRVNVQLASVVNDRAIKIMIWERGSGETSASGSSSCAAASAAVRLGLVRSPVLVHSPGGSVNVEVDEEFNLMLSGPVSAICEGYLSTPFVKSLGRC